MFRKLSVLKKVVILVTMLMFSGVVISTSFAQNEYPCGNAFQCFEEAVKRMNQAKKELKSAENRISSLSNDISALKELINKQQTEIGKINKESETDKMNLTNELKKITPVGTIVSSMLTPEQFTWATGDNTEPDLKKRKWVLADGRDVTNSDYARITGKNNIPDLRGMFIRGKNNVRNDGKENPGGELDLGVYQSDELKKHSHSTVQMIHNDNIDGIDSAVTHSYEHHNETRETGIIGEAETRPRNVTVNFYIKIN